MPSIFTAHAWYWLTARSTAPERPCTATGVYCVRMVPSPSIAERLSPQHAAVPSALRAQAEKALAAAEMRTPLPPPATVLGPSAVLRGPPPLSAVCV